MLKTVVALLLALLLTSGVRKFTNVHRMIIYLPAIVPMIVVGIVFKSILHPSTGVLNVFLHAIGLECSRPRLVNKPQIGTLFCHLC